MLYPVIPIYLKEIGFTVFWIGVLEGVVNFTAGISKGYFGKLSDEKGVRLPFIKLGYLLSAVSKPLMATFAYPLWIFFCENSGQVRQRCSYCSKRCTAFAGGYSGNKSKGVWFPSEYGYGGCSHRANTGFDFFDHI